MALYNAMGSTVLAQHARKHADWNAVEQASQGRRAYTGEVADKESELVGAPIRFMPDEGSVKATRETQAAIDTKIKYALAVCNELEKSIREAYHDRQHGNRANK